MLALISYICAAVLLVTNLFVKENVLNRLGLITTALGYCFNLRVDDKVGGSRRQRGVEDRNKRGLAILSVGQPLRADPWVLRRRSFDNAGGNTEAKISSTRRNVDADPRRDIVAGNDAW